MLKLGFGTGRQVSEVIIIVFEEVCRPEDKVKTEVECKKADAIVLTYACDRPQTHERLSSYWLPELRRLEVSAALTYAYFLLQICIGVDFLCWLADQSACYCGRM